MRIFGPPVQPVNSQLHFKGNKKWNEIPLAVRKHEQAVQAWEAINNDPSASSPERRDFKQKKEEAEASAKTAERIVRTFERLGGDVTKEKTKQVVDFLAERLTGSPAPGELGDKVGEKVSSVASWAAKPLGVVTANAHYVASSSEYKSWEDAQKQAEEDGCTIM